MARRKTIAIAKEDILNFSQEVLDTLGKEFILVCVSETPIDVNGVKIVNKKPPAFLTLRSNSILFNGDVHSMKEQLLSLKGRKVALDFDGVINSYKSGWTGEDNVVDEPVEGIIDFIKEFTNEYEFVVYSSRCRSEVGIAAMKEFFSKNGVTKLLDVEYVTMIDSDCILIDDRVLDYTMVDDIIESVRTFTPWTK